MARPRKVTDAEILSVARAVFLEHGAGISTSRIADELGVSQAALFKRFGTKQALMLRALLPPAVPPWATIATEGPDDRPVGVQLEEISRAILSFFVEMLPCILVLRSSGALEDLLKHFDVPPPVVGHRAVTAWFERAMEQGRIRRCDASMLAFNFIGAFHGRVMVNHITRGHFGDVDIDAYAAHTAELLLRGLEVRP